ncbi:MAG: ATP-binding protein, partial [Myxococcota bacterium]
KEVGKGTGLGLSLSHGIIERHGGRIQIQSEPGQGATFEIDLPLEAPEIAEEGEELGTASPARAM